MQRIILIWSTCRPETMRETYAHWMRTADDINRIVTKVSVDTEEEKALIPEFNIAIVGEKECGSVKAINAITATLEPGPDDIIIVVQDDVYPVNHCDTWVYEQFKEYRGCVMADDGLQYGGCITMPIMHADCFHALNKIINHPAYFHQFADAELYENVTALQMVKNLRNCSPLFEHRHWGIGKRKFDTGDCPQAKYRDRDIVTYQQRMLMPLSERLLEIM